MLLLGCLGEKYVKTIHTGFYAISYLFEILSPPPYHYNMGRDKFMVFSKLRDIPYTQELLLVSSTETTSPVGALECEIRRRQEKIRKNRGFTYSNNHLRSKNCNALHYRRLLSPEKHLQAG